MKFIQRLWKEEEGQGLVEYGLLIVLVVCLISMPAIMGWKRSERFNEVQALLREVFYSGLDQISRKQP